MYLSVTKCSPHTTYTLRLGGFNDVKMSTNVFFDLYFLEHDKMVSHSLFPPLLTVWSTAAFNYVSKFTDTTLLSRVFCHAVFLRNITQ